jgi:hypothetical protein
MASAADEMSHPVESMGGHSLQGERGGKFPAARAIRL